MSTEPAPERTPPVPKPLTDDGRLPTLISIGALVLLVTLGVILIALV